MAHGDPAFQHEGIDVVPAVTRSARISALRISLARGDDDALELRRRPWRSATALRPASSSLSSHFAISAPNRAG
jgi:hypothetical protein